MFEGSSDHNVYCLDASSGTQIWAFTTGGLIGRSSPAIFNNRVYVGSWDNRVYCLNESNGLQIWSFITGGVVRSSTVVEVRVFVGSLDGFATV